MFDRGKPLDLRIVGDHSVTEGWCTYCHRTTLWELTVTATNAVLFECARCRKISQTVTYASPAPSAVARAQAPT